MAKATKEDKPYHTITVRLRPADYAYLKARKVQVSEAEARVVPYTEILIKGLRAMQEASPAKAARGR